MKYVGTYSDPKDIVTKDKLEAAVPTKTSQLENDSGFITTAPVTSVNSKTGAVVLTASDVSAMPNVPVTAVDNGKFLRVVNGAWAAVAIADANGVKF